MRAMCAFFFWSPLSNGMRGMSGQIARVSVDAIAGMPATVNDEASLTTPETTVRSFEVRSPAELRSKEIAGAVESLTTVSEVEAVFPRASLALTSIVFDPSIKETAELNAPEPST